MNKGFVLIGLPLILIAPASARAESHGPVLVQQSAVCFVGPKAGLLLQGQGQKYSTEFPRMNSVRQTLSIDSTTSVRAEVEGCTGPLLSQLHLKKTAFAAKDFSPNEVLKFIESAVSKLQFADEHFKKDLLRILKIPTKKKDETKKFRLLTDGIQEISDSVFDAKGGWNVLVFLVADELWVDISKRQVEKDSLIIPLGDGCSFYILDPIFGKTAKYPVKTQIKPNFVRQQIKLPGGAQVEAVHEGCTETDTYTLKIELPIRPQTEWHQAIRSILKDLPLVYQKFRFMDESQYDLLPIEPQNGNTASFMACAKKDTESCKKRIEKHDVDEDVELVKIRKESEKRLIELISTSHVS